MLRARARCGSGVKVVAISGGGKVSPDTYLHLALKLGAHAALAKPIRPDEAVCLAKRPLERARGR